MSIALWAVVMVAAIALSRVLGAHMSSARWAFAAYGLYILGVTAAVVLGVTA